MANLKFYGSVVEILPQETGVTQQGTQWWSQAFILEELGTQFPSRAQFVLYGNHLNEENVRHVALGNDVTVSSNIKLREWVGSQDGRRKSSTELRAWKVVQGNATEEIKPVKQDGEFKPVFASPTIESDDNAINGIF